MIASAPCTRGARLHDRSCGLESLGRGWNPEDAVGIPRTRTLFAQLVPCFLRALDQLLRRLQLLLGQPVLQLRRRHLCNLSGREIRTCDSVSLHAWRPHDVSLHALRQLVRVGIP